MLEFPFKLAHNIGLQYNSNGSITRNLANRATNSASRVRSQMFLGGIGSFEWDIWFCCCSLLTFNVLVPGGGLYEMCACE